MHLTKPAICATLISLNIASNKNSACNNLFLIAIIASFAIMAIMSINKHSTKFISMADRGLDMLSSKGLTRKIITFALPLMASGIVQQSFNSIDVAVVGKFVGSHALAAVGSNGPVIGLIVNLFVGIAVGANVIISTYLGQRNREGVQRAVATSSLIALLGGLLLLVIGVCIARPIHELLGTPENIIDDAAGYLRLFAVGFPAMLIYNFGSAILRSIGDTKRPFYWLVAGGVVNVSLNLVFVLVCGMGVYGVALGTVLSNCVSAGGVVWILTHEKSHVRLELRALKLWRTQSNKILQVGVPAGVQGMVFSLSNLFIQSAINSYGAEAVAGSAAALNFEMYCYFIISSFVQAVVAFTSQNYGAGNLHQCRVIFGRCMALAVVSCLLLNVLIVVFHKDFISIFTNSPEAMVYATDRVFAVLIFQCLACTYEVAGGSLRALGYSMTPTLFTIFGTCVVRVTWVSLARFESFSELLTIYPITWIITGTSVVTAWFVIAKKLRL
jgi:putative MATE family efflux protein